MSALATPEQRAAAGQLRDRIHLILERRLLERDFHAFVRAAWHVMESQPFIDGKHIEGYCRHLEHAVETPDYKVLFNVPPAFSKSTVCSVAYPAWVWTRYPHWRFQCHSYAEKLAIRDSIKCRALIESDWYQQRWPIKFRGDQNLKTMFENTAGGLRMAGTITGGTGFHNHFLILDDLQSVQQAESEAELERLTEWWTLTMPLRGASLHRRTIAVCQRLRENDFSEMFLRGGGVDHVKLPMRFEPDNAMKPTSIGWRDWRTEEGELLAPQQFPESKVQAVERELMLHYGPYGPASQLQQRPMARSGGMFQRDWFKIIPAPPPEAIRVRYWDKSGTEGGGKYTAGVLIGKTPRGVFFVEDVVRGQWSAGTRNKVMKLTAQLDYMRYGHGVVIMIEQEPGSGGKESGEISVQDLAGYIVKLDRPNKSKEVRAEPMAGQLEIGNLYLIEGEWNEALIQEFCLFPKGRYADVVDAASGGFNKLALADIVSPEESETVIETVTQ